MTRIFYFLCMIMTIPVYAQNVGLGTTTPNSSAVLDISSTTKGVLVPRMTTAQRSAIAAPGTGVLVYDTNTGSFQFFNGTAWVDLHAVTVSDWSLTGNTGTTPGVQYLGTTDNVPMVFKVNNVQQGELYPNGTVAIGQKAALNSTAGSNVALGSSALFSTTSRSNQVAIGDSSLFSNVLGVSNTAAGSKTLYANTTGSFNTASGFQSLKANTTGQRNVGVGTNTLHENSSGNYNTAAGLNALYNHNADHSTGLGNKALTANTTGVDNTAIGSNALIQNTTGSGNTALGAPALWSNFTGSNNTLIGKDADVTVDGLVNATAIGYASRVSASNRLILGGTGNAAVNVGIGTSTPGARLHVVGGTNATGSSGGFIQMGYTTGTNMGIDNKSIQVRNNGVPSKLFLQYEGGGTQIGGLQNPITITTDSKVYRALPESNTADLLPIAYGKINYATGIVSGTGNMTFIADGYGSYRVILLGEPDLYAQRDRYSVFVTLHTDTGCAATAQIESDNSIHIYIKRPWVNYTNSSCNDANGCSIFSQITNFTFDKAVDSDLSLLIFKN